MNGGVGIDKGLNANNWQQLLEPFLDIIYAVGFAPSDIKIDFIK